MAIIPLRQYNREIEGMIDSGQIDEAIAHCRHILQTYPKHIQTYRLLGKTYLESQRYTDASDIFLRILAVVPDDFVAHVGMSIIREDENNLDAAIWHMERAFETQPSNAAIQEELRRLYGRRDGMEPPKIRLTRGALARMYARGNLYEQAIAELRSALSEDPQRVDLQVLLAQMYFHSGQRVESIDICNNVVKKYPYCLDANRLLVATLPETNRAEDAEEYRQRLIALDPYYTSAAPRALNADDVPENAINIERLVYRAGQPVSGAPEQPAWASSLGVAFEKEGSEQLPEWLQEEESPALTPGRTPVEAAPFSWETPEEKTEEIPETPPQEEAIPDWMKEAGWQPATGEAVEGPVTFDLEETEGEIAKGEIPDWLKDMAPEGALNEELPPLGEDESEAVLPWLQEKEPGPTDTIISWLEEAKPEEQPQAGVETAAPGVESAAPGAETELPDWLHEEGTATSPEPVAEEPQATEEEEEIPSWLSDLEQAKEKPSGITDWLRSSALPTEPEAVPEPAPEETVSSVPPGLADQDAAIAWLESLAAQHGAKEEELITKPEERPEIPPDWVQEGVPTETQPAIPAVEEPTLPAAQETAEEIELPDWLHDMAPGEAAPAAPPAEVTEQPEAAEEAELSNWLHEMEPSEEITPSAESTAPLDAAEEAELPDWLRSMAPAEEAVSAPEAETPAPPEDIEKAELPDWLLDMAPGETELPSSAEVPEKFEAAEEAGLPAWLSELESREEEVPAPSPEPPAVSAEETPAWLQEMAPEEAVPEPASEVPAESVPVEEIPTWLQEMAPEEIAPEPVSETPVEPAPIEETPLLVQEMETAIPEVLAPAETPSVPPTPDLTDQDAALAWLESLAVQHGAKEEELITKPEERPETPPDWVQESVVSEIPSEEIIPEPVEEEAEIPTWLKEEETARSEEPAAPAEELPAWFQEMAPEEAAPEPVSEVPVEPAPTEEITTWLQEMAPEEAAPEPVPAEEIPAWLQETPLEEAAPEPISEAPVEPAPSEELPQWLQEMAPEEESVAPISEAPVEPAPTEEVPAWLQEMAPEEEAPEPVSEVPVEPAQVEEVPAWLQEMAPEEAAPETVSEAPAEAVPAEEVPAWLQEEPTVPPVEQIDINIASMNQLERLPGVGFVLAQNIVNHRDAHGAFHNLDELANIPGISADVINGIRGLVTVPAPVVEAVPAFAGDAEAILSQARKDMGGGQSAAAMAKYSRLVQKSYRLDTIIHELQDALYRFPVDIDVWQTLGDAYMRNDNLQEALDAYTKAEELLR